MWTVRTCNVLYFRRWRNKITEKKISRISVNIRSIQWWFEGKEGSLLGRKRVDKGEGGPRGQNPRCYSWGACQGFRSRWAFLCTSTSWQPRPHQLVGRRLLRGGRDKAVVNRALSTRPRWAGTEPQPSSVLGLDSTPVSLLCSTLWKGCMPWTGYSLCHVCSFDGLWRFLQGIIFEG
jgi:hypothetical protein